MSSASRSIATSSVRPPCGPPSPGAARDAIPPAATWSPPVSRVPDEPGFYTIGAKSFGRATDFFLELGHAQAEAVAAIVAAGLEAR